MISDLQIKYIRNYSIHQDYIQYVNPDNIQIQIITPYDTSDFSKPIEDTLFWTNYDYFYFLEEETMDQVFRGRVSEYIIRDVRISPAKIHTLRFLYQNEIYGFYFDKNNNLQYEKFERNYGCTEDLPCKDHHCTGDFCNCIEACERALEFPTRYCQFHYQSYRSCIVSISKLITVDYAYNGVEYQFKGREECFKKYTETTNFYSMVDHHSISGSMEVKAQ